MSQRKYSRWEDAMVQQAALLEWSRTGFGHRYLQSFFSDMNAKHNMEARRPVNLLHAIQLQTLEMAEPIYVSEEVTAVVDEARKSWRPERLLPGDVFTPNGFMWLPRPILLDDMPPTEAHPFRAVPPEGTLNGYIPVRAIAWMALHTEDLSAGTYWISYYTHIEDEFALADELGTPSRFDPLGAPPGMAPFKETREQIARDLPLSLVHMWQWSWGEEGEWTNWSDPDAYDVTPDDSVEQMMERARQQCSLIQSIWRIARQLVPAKQRPQRQWWRDAARKGVKHKDVTVIALRRTRKSNDDEERGEGHELSVRFVVRGHWRNQWYPTLQDHRQVWIAPYVKGPDDAPFKNTERAWAFVR